MYYVYILRSLKDGRLYTGVTADLAQRLIEHNIGKNKATRHRRPLVLVYSEEYSSRSEAVRREYYLKSKKGSFDKFQLAKLEVRALARSAVRSRYAPRMQIGFA
jgi:putative endonuclease